MTKAGEKIKAGLLEALDWAKERRKQEEAQRALESGEIPHGDNSFTPSPKVVQKPQ